MTLLEASEIIRMFATGDPALGKWGWDDFVSVSDPDPAVNALRLRAGRVNLDYPSDNPSHWCSKAGIAVLLTIADEAARAHSAVGID
ncbi:hypothetical protein [uncultured Maricaulis sp.]|uniref:hypothetical protein n=1 Tax=uncultured Maricaulis sp. TaxID=174710 RepID=UPI0030D88DE7|tara:strand:+ start:4201 stop:4461 length:261 start_codon:yes stop_codon:yes gene_type:complete